MSREVLATVAAALAAAFLYALSNVYQQSEAEQIDDDESMKLDLGDLRSPQTAAGLADYGVRYVVVHPAVPGGDPQNMRRQHYILRFTSPDGSVWQVDSAPAPTRIISANQ